MIERISAEVAARIVWFVGGLLLAVIGLISPRRAELGVINAAKNISYNR